MKKEILRRGIRARDVCVCERERERERDNGNKKTKTNTCSQGKVNTKGKAEVTCEFSLKQSVHLNSRNSYLMPSITNI